jgi:hypothetical protein
MQEEQGQGGVSSAHLATRATKLGDEHGILVIVRTHLIPPEWVKKT